MPTFKLNGYIRSEELGGLCLEERIFTVGAESIEQAAEKLGGTLVAPKDERERRFATFQRRFIPSPDTATRIADTALLSHGIQPGDRDEQNVRLLVTPPLGLFDVLKLEGLGIVR